MKEHLAKTRLLSDPGATQRDEVQRGEVQQGEVQQGYVQQGEVQPESQKSADIATKYGGPSEAARAYELTHISKLHQF